MTTGSLGELLLAEMAAVCVIEDGQSAEHWAGAQAHRVAERLNRFRAPCPPLRPVVFWSVKVTAFTLPGPYIFISRELVQRLPHDAAVAFVLAHEMAHHDLRHVSASRDETRGLARNLLKMARCAIRRLATNPEDEADADRYALQLCEQAGYPTAGCLEAVRVLVSHSIDWGDIEGVFGPEEEDVAGADERPGRRQRARRWWWQRRRGYQSLLERKARLEAAVPPSSTSQSDASPFRAAGISAQHNRCNGCGHAKVTWPGDLCPVCLRRLHFDRRVEEAVKEVVREERRSAFFENWVGILFILALVALLTIVGYCRPHTTEALETHRYSQYR